MIKAVDVSAAVDALSPLATWWAEALLRAGVQGAIAAVLVWGALRLIPRVAPAVQAWLWRLVFLKFVAAMILPIPVPWGGAGVVPGVTAGPAQPAWLPLVTLLASAAGIGVWLRGLWHEAAKLRRLRRSAEICTDEMLLNALRALAVRLRTRLPELRISGEVQRPVLVGAFGPGILLPRQFVAACAPADLRMILAHELAHVRRRDLAWNWLPCLVHGVFFFHPAIWLAGRELRLAQDAACDAAALRTTRASPAAYGRLLMEISQLPQPPQRALWAAAGAVEDFRSLRRRLSLLAQGTCSVLSPATLAAVLLAVGVAPSWKAQHAQAPAQPDARGEPAARDPAAAAVLSPARRIAGPPAASGAGPRAPAKAPAAAGAVPSTAEPRPPAVR